MGKSFLVTRVLEDICRQHRGILKLLVSGGATKRGDDFVEVFDKLVPTNLEIKGRARDYFSRCRKLVRARADFMSSVESELSRKGKSEDEKKSVLGFLRFGKALNRFSPKTKPYVDFEAIDKLGPKAADKGDSSADPSRSEQELVEGIGALRALAVHDWRLMPEIVKRWTGTRYRSDMKRDLLGLAADELVRDLRRLVRDPTLGENNTHPSAPFQQLFLVIDDFEILGAVLSEFLFSKLLPRVKRCRFSTVLIVIGREPLMQSIPNYYSEFENEIKAQVALDPFTRDQAPKYLETNDTTGEEAENIYEWTKGNPYLLSLRRRGSGGLDAAQAYERSTKQMGSRQRNWFDHIIYLEEVNIDTVSWVLPSEQVDQVQYWFERDESIRQEKIDAYRIDPILRNQTLYYFSKHSPTKHLEMLERVRQRIGD